jgi:hypothetical protein
MQRLHRCVSEHTAISVQGKHACKKGTTAIKANQMNTDAREHRQLSLAFLLETEKLVDLYYDKSSEQLLEAIKDEDRLLERCHDVGRKLEILGKMLANEAESRHNRLEKRGSHKKSSRSKHGKQDVEWGLAGRGGGGWGMGWRGGWSGAGLVGLGLLEGTAIGAIGASWMYPRVYPTTTIVEQPVVMQQPQTQPVVVQQPQTQPVVMQQPQTQPAVVQQPQRQPIAMQQPQRQPIAMQQPQRQPIAMQQPETQGSYGAAKLVSSYLKERRKSRDFGKIDWNKK